MCTGLKRRMVMKSVNYCLTELEANVLEYPLPSKSIQLNLSLASS